MIDINKLQFYSGNPIDKIVATPDPVIITNSGGTTQAPQTAFLTSDTYPNPYGKACFVRYKWSIDGQNFNAGEAHLVYTFTINTVAPAPVTSNTLSGLQAAVAIGVSNNTVTILTASGYHGTVTDNGTVYTYTPIAQNFTVQYTLFTRE